MRIPETLISIIKAKVHEQLGSEAKVYLFGSRLDDAAKGGDLDLLVISRTAIEAPTNIGVLLEAQISRAFHGRKADVLLSAPNLKSFAIHQIALEQGIEL